MQFVADLHLTALERDRACVSVCVAEWITVAVVFVAVLLLTFSLYFLLPLRVVIYLFIFFLASFFVAGDFYSLLLILFRVSRNSLKSP